MKQDLDGCIKRFELWAKVNSEQGDAKSEEASLICISLFRDAVVTLMSCFDTQGSYNLNAEIVYANVDGGLECFHYLKVLRDTWIAHRFGPERQAVACVAIHPETGDLLGPAEASLNRFDAGPEVYDDLILFTTIAKNFVSAEFQAKQLEYLTAVNALFPTQRLRLPEAKLRAPNQYQARMARRKFGNIARTTE